MKPLQPPPALLKDFGAEYLTVSSSACIYTPGFKVAEMNVKFVSFDYLFIISSL